MDVILCATRGGEASIRTQQRAIALAKEQGAKLVFIFVSDVSFLEHYTAPRVPAMEGEMEHLGEFLLLMAKERAEKAGVEASFVVKKGTFSTALVEAAKEFDASLMVLGRPAAHNITTLDYLENTLAKRLREEANSDMLIV
ncbi:MAG: universal stress protein [Chloroflexi bacterium]|nr:universal stress protein [Chloroflexota bacterium]